MPRAVGRESFFVILNAANRMVNLKAMHIPKQREVYVIPLRPSSLATRRLNDH